MSKEAAEDANTKLSFGRIEIEKGRPHSSQKCVHYDLALEVVQGLQRIGQYSHQDGAPLRGKCFL